MVCMYIGHGQKLLLISQNQVSRGKSGVVAVTLCNRV